MTEVLRIRNPNAFDLEPIQRLMEAAYAGHNSVEPELAVEDLRPNVHREDVAFLVGREKGALKAMAVAQWPGTKAPACVVKHFHNRGSKALREQLIAAVVDFAKAGGYEKLVAFDANKRPRAFQRLFQLAGPSREIGRAYEFDLTGGEDGRHSG